MKGLQQNSSWQEVQIHFLFVEKKKRYLNRSLKMIFEERDAALLWPFVGKTRGSWLWINPLYACDKGSVAISLIRDDVCLEIAKSHSGGQQISQQSLGVWEEQKKSCKG